MVDSVLIGDRVRFESAAGVIRGEVVSIRLARNAKGDLIPWLSINHIINNRTNTVVLCGSEDYLKMMKFRVNFRDAA